MSDPTTAAGGAAVYKLGGWLMIFVAPLLAFALGTQIVPLDKDDPHRDAVRRILGCFISSLVFAVAGLIVLHRNWPWAFESSRTVAVIAGLPDWAGPLTIIWCLFIVGALPGWWIVAPLLRWFAARKDQTVEQIAGDARNLLKP